MVHAWLENEDAQLLVDALQAYVPALERDVEGCWQEKQRLARRRTYLRMHPEAAHDEEEGFLEQYRLAQQVEDDRLRWTRATLSRAASLGRMLHV